MLQESSHLRVCVFASHVFFRAKQQIKKENIQKRGKRMQIENFVSVALASAAEKVFVDWWK